MFRHVSFKMLGLVQGNVCVFVPSLSHPFLCEVFSVPGRTHQTFLTVQTLSWMARFNLMNATCSWLCGPVSFTKKKSYPRVNKRISHPVQLRGLLSGFSRWKHSERKQLENINSKAANESSEQTQRETVWCQKCLYKACMAHMICLDHLQISFVPKSSF